MNIILRPLALIPYFILSISLSYPKSPEVKGVPSLRKEGSLTKVDVFQRKLRFIKHSSMILLSTRFTVT